MLKMPETIHSYREDARYKDLFSLLSEAGYNQHFIDSVYLTPEFTEKSEDLYDTIVENDNAPLASRAFEIAHAPAESFSHNRYE